MNRRATWCTALLALAVSATIGCERAGGAAGDGMEWESLGAFGCKVSRGQVWCTGGNGWAMRGLGHNLAMPAELTVVPGITDATQVAVGTTHVCALRRNGSVSCWGSLLWGATGYPKPTISSPDIAANDPSLLQMTPRAVPGLAGVTQIGATNGVTCALLRDGSVECWGDNILEERPPGPLPMLGFPTGTQLYTGGSYICVLGVDRVLYCKGDLWTGSDDDRPIRTPRALFRDVSPRDLQPGAHGICSTRGDKRQCWGRPPEWSPWDPD